MSRQGGTWRLVPVGAATDAVQAPFSHFFMKLVFAAPASGLPSALTAEKAVELAKRAIDAGGLT